MAPGRLRITRRNRRRYGNQTAMTRTTTPPTKLGQHAFPWPAKRTGGLPIGYGRRRHSTRIIAPTTKSMKTPNNIANRISSAIPEKRTAAKVVSLRFGQAGAS
jgi:hypothetical protein